VVLLVVAAASDCQTSVFYDVSEKEENRRASVVF